MSLLMEALKTAEEARREIEGRPPPAASAPFSADPAFGSPADSLPDFLSDSLLDPSPRFDEAARFSAEPAMPPERAAPDGDVARERSAARKVFAAKRPEPGNALGLIVGAGVLVILGVGGHFWWQLRAVGSSGAARPAAVATPAAALATQAPDVPVIPIASPKPSLSSPPAETLIPARPVREAAPPAGKPAALAPVAPAPDSPHRAPSDAAVALRLTKAVPQENSVLERAYEALQSGRDDEARRAYEQALRADGKNVDALLGLATLAARQGRSDTARAYYLRAFEADPSDATARAGVLGTGRQGDEAAAESRLKTALAQAPDSPPLNFALGNLYARQQRWSEAQQAYFRAYTGDPGNPDLIFNLAVSLDHLHQGRLAVQYYRMAIDAGGARAAAFARDAADARLLELEKIEGALPPQTPPAGE